MSELKPDWVIIKHNLRRAADDLKAFFIHPVNGMKKVPDWDPTTAAIIAGGFGAASGVIGSIFSRSLFGFLMSFLIVPISSLLAVGLCAGFFYYIFLFLFKTSVRYTDLYIISTLAAVPTYLSLTVSPQLPPMTLVGVALTLYLFYVAFRETFRISSQHLGRLMVGLFIFYSACWAMNSLNLERGRQSLKRMATPESLDILEKEMND